MDIETLKELFDAKLDPIKKDINELKEGQSNFLNIISVQSRHDEALDNLKIEVKECRTCVSRMKDKNGNRMWEIIRYGIAGIIGGVVGKYFN